MNAHYVLAVMWIGYCVIHSFLASMTIKKSIQSLMHSWFKYYRPLYSIFAATTLAAILWFQYSIESPQLFSSYTFIQLTGIVLTVTGLTLMLICINKYFYELSGLQAIKESFAKNTLQQSGLHKYVRHPLYLGTLLFIWGLFLIFPLMSNGIAVAIITVYVVVGIRIEEKKLHIEYGTSYLEYSKRVPMLIPSILKNKKGSV